MTLFFWLLLSGLNADGFGATDYFLRPAGDDSAIGTSSNAAWRTMGKVNGTRLQPGDRVLFEAGAEFVGNLELTSEDAGASNAPVVIGAFGQGRATLRAGPGTGIRVENAGGIVIRDLVIIGSGRKNNTGHGILCDNVQSTPRRLDHLRIENVEVSGFGMFGILVSGNQSGFRSVRITDCVLRDNLRGGMEVSGRLPYDAKQYAHEDVTVSHCRAFDNTGDPAYLKNHSGSGIVLYQVDGGLMDQCLAWNNGALCQSRTGGGVGLWTCASRRVVIQNCESFANKTGHADGGGFDIDGGSEECVLQYNYSHDNDGPGLMVYTYPYASHSDRGNIVRFNVTENDSRKNRNYAGIWVRSDGQGMRGIEIYNNTVLVGPWADQAVYVQGTGVEARLRNNIIIAQGGTVPMRVEKPEASVRCENNLYWRDGLPFEVKWGDRTYASLGDWRAREGQELANGKPVGLFANPALPAAGGSIQSAEPGSTAGLRSFQPSASSPALKGGLDLRQHPGLATGSRDVLGNPLPEIGTFPLGAFSQQAGR